MQNDTIHTLSPDYPHDQLIALNEAVSFRDHPGNGFELSRSPFTRVDLSKVRELWDEHPDSRLAAYSAHIPANALADGLFRRSVAPLLSQEANVFMLRSGRTLRGCASWRQLEWDSEQFGFCAGRLDALFASGTYEANVAAKRLLLSKLIENCHAQKVRHLTARVDAGDLGSIHALEQTHFQWIDAIQTFALEIPSAPAAPRVEGFELREFRDIDLADVLALARSAYVYDRFHADPALPCTIADRVNEEWLRNACMGHGADHVVIAADKLGVIGYVTCKVEDDLQEDEKALLGTIVMVATAPRARGRGVAVAATLDAVRWFAERGVRIVEVGTQFRNIPAARVYQKCQFRQVAATLTFTRTIK